MKVLKPLLLTLFYSTFASAAFCQQLPYKNASVPVDARVKDLLSRMTTLEKIRQLDMYRGWSVSPMTEQTHEALKLDEKLINAAFAKGSFGSLHDFYPAYTSLSNEVQRHAVTKTRLGIPVLFIEEGLHGYSRKGSTSFPVPLQLAATWDTALVYQVGRAIGRESRANGTAMILAPLLDVSRDPRWGRQEETFGEDTYLVSEIGLAMVKGLQGGDVSRHDAVVSEPKHYVVHPVPEAGSNQGPVNIGVREIRSSHLPTFEKAVKQGGALGIMAAYHEIDGLPMVFNRWLLTDVLRKEYGFKGFVLSDLGAVRMGLENHRTATSRADAMAQTINAGLNMQFYDFGHDEFEQALDSALKMKMLTPARLDTAVAEVLRVKFLLGLFDRPYIDTTLLAKVTRSTAHQQLAQRAAERGVVLLKNDKNILPLKDIRNLVVVGPLAKSNYLGGYSNTEDTAISILSGLTQRAGDRLQIRYIAGFDQSVISTADAVVVVLGEDLQVVGEGKDRAALQLDTAQLTLVRQLSATGKPLAAVLLNGRALCLGPVAAQVPAIVEGWFGGEKGGQAIADVLLGITNPSGKLPVSFPRSEGQLPYYYSHKPTSYHRYVDEKDTPLFPFGHGLSYTTFKYDQLELPAAQVKDSFTIRVTVTNTGTVAGEEVVQVYLRDEVATVTTPAKALKAFGRVALQPGERRQLTFRLSALEALGLWNRDMKHVIEPGTFLVMVGSSSDDIRLKGQFHVN
ncbi:glycoside hydrolase family 3 N-terminal domain-containing protein [Chitinophaga sp. sic0106]|uniref:glycoside hydrolase family 3 N-terminal domain-containing protein n=1 Tax=Chitinophaga sp. sic0106 TaxID=2854785 RepID=UPI001C481976|nr:glycoside hydrolase family 3 N-terminal domain-containing protein [Chitinophaga sp. sic0106]MBV7531059.1 glycoside hydrolase family 3 C-terminal domain-containing protein [Chitinophaga sp. sic0106]